MGSKGDQDVVLMERIATHYGRSEIGDSRSFLPRASTGSGWRVTSGPVLRKVQYRTSVGWPLREVYITIDCEPDQ